MSDPVLIGINIGYIEPYWIMVNESLLAYAKNLPVKLIVLNLNARTEFSESGIEQLIEEMVGQKLGALISWSLPNRVLERILDTNIPIILFTDTDKSHPLLFSVSNLYDAAGLVLRYVAGKLNYRGTILIIDGIELPDGRLDRRYSGFTDAARAFPNINLLRIPAPYPPSDAGPFIESGLLEIDQPVNAIIGASDYLVLEAQRIAHKVGLLRNDTLVAGIGGDPLALDAIASGKMIATVELLPPRVCHQLFEVAYRTALGSPLPRDLHFNPTLVTSDNIGKVIHEKFATFSRLPSRMVGLNREQQERHTQQLETALLAIRDISSVLDHKQVLFKVFGIIRENYGFEKAYVFLFSRDRQALVWQNPEGENQGSVEVSLREGGILGKVYITGEDEFIHDAQNSMRYSRDPAFPNTRSRVVVPIRLGGEILGVLDLHSYHLVEHDQEVALGLQLMADQIGIALRNATLYENAVHAQAKAEEADGLKTRLLANVSHELRTPLNLIMSYSQLALAGTTGDSPASPTLTDDLSHIYSNASHLLRLINDLLDLSRTEINELRLYPEVLAPRTLMEDAFTSMKFDLALSGDVEWRLELPDQLPLIQADPVRFRQILYNLLSNAAKFTEKGHIVLGAKVELPYLHIWVQDTGRGITQALHDRIFEPFATSLAPGKRREEGIGLGLALTRRFIAMHDGAITLESTPGSGSTFHIYLPLPNLTGMPNAPSDNCQRVLLVISAQTKCNTGISEIAARQGLQVTQIRPGDDIERVLEGMCPVSVAWDISQVGCGDWELVEFIRKHPVIGKLPFIMFSPDTNAASATGSGTIGVVVKPLSAHTLQDLTEALRPSRPCGSVLIVDDDPPTCELYRRTVQKSLPGYEVHSIYNGQHAIDWLSLSTPALIILDLIMPDVSGFEVLDFIRSNSRTRHVPVLVISGHVLSSEHIKRLDHGNVTLQLKGILSEDEMANMFSRTLSGEKTLSQATSAVVRNALNYVQTHYKQPLERQTIANAIGVGETYLSSIFHQELDISLWDYLNRMRISEAKRLLVETTKPLHLIAEEVGFEDPAYFSRMFRKQTGMPPRAYRKGLRT